MNLGQRIVGVVALAAILWLVGSYLSAPVPFIGWIAYAPLSHASIPAPPAAVVRYHRLFLVAQDGISPVENLFVWFGLVLGWFGGSFVLLRGPRLHRSATPLSGSRSLEGRVAESEDPSV